VAGNLGHYANVLDYIPSSIKSDEFKALKAHTEWNDLCKKLVQGDELWRFRNPRKYWNALADREGIAVIRNEDTIGWVITTGN
jgi:hypothetical protein